MSIISLTCFTLNTFSAEEDLEICCYSLREVNSAVFYIISAKFLSVSVLSDKSS